MGGRQGRGEEVKDMKKEKAAKLAAQNGEAVTEQNENEENGTDLNN